MKKQINNGRSHRSNPKDKKEKPQKKHKQKNTVRRICRVHGLPTKQTLTGNAVPRSDYLREILCVDDLLSKKPSGASKDHAAILLSAHF